MPAGPTTSGVQAIEEYHVTASVRGSSRDTVLVLGIAPPGDRGSTAALLAAARYWSKRHHPDQPPALTVRFAVLPTVPGIDTQDLVTSYLAQRERTVAQAVAVIALDPHGPTGINTNENEFQPFLSELLWTPAANIETVTDPANTRSPLATALMTLQLPSIWLNPVSAAPEGACTEAVAKEMATASALLLDMLERAGRALARPEDENGITLTD